MKYAVIRIKNNQYKVVEGEELLVDKLNDKTIDSEVLLYVDGKNIKLGDPVIKKAKVKIKVIEEEVKGEKIHVQTFKAKSRYRRKKGFRPVYSRIKIEKLSLT